MLTQAAGLAAWSAHPLSRALVQAHETEKAQEPAPGQGMHPLGCAQEAWTQVEEHPGCGLQGTDCAGAVWRLGSRRWVESALTDALPVDTPPGHTLQLWWGTGGKASHRFELQERLRPDAIATVARLSQAGLPVTVLSGDLKEHVQAMAQRMGAAVAVGAASPEDKLAAVQSAQRQGATVIMVGDGLNDGPVLAQADVSFAFANSHSTAGASLTQVHADVVLMSGRLSDVTDTLDLARRTLRIMGQNMVWAALYNAACVPLAWAGLLPPWAAGLGMAASSLLVVLNALRLSGSRPSVARY